MSAVVEAAFPGQLHDVRKLLAERRLIRPHVDLLDAGIVDDDPAAPQHHQFASRGGVASLSSVFIDLVGKLVFPSEEMIDHRGFPRTARSDEGNGDARLQISLQRLETALFL